MHCGRTDHQRISHHRCPFNPRNLTPREPPLPQQDPRSPRRHPPTAAPPPPPPPPPEDSSEDDSSDSDSDRTTESQQLRFQRSAAIRQRRIERYNAENPHLPPILPRRNGAARPSPIDRSRMLGNITRELGDSSDDEMTGIQVDTRLPDMNELYNVINDHPHTFGNTISSLRRAIGEATNNSVSLSEYREMRQALDAARTTQHVLASLLTSANQREENRDDVRRPSVAVKASLDKLMEDLDEYKELIPEGLYLKWCNGLQNIYRLTS